MAENLFFPDKFSMIDDSGYIMSHVTYDMKHD